MAMMGHSSKKAYIPKPTYKPAPKPVQPKTTAYIPKYVPPPKPVAKPKPTPPKTTAYIPKQVAPPKPVAKAPAISSGTAAEIKRKAQAGIPMDSPTPEKLALYNQYKPKSTPKAPVGKMNDIYKDTHKPPPKVAPKAPTGKMKDIYSDMHKTPAKPVYKPSPSPKAPVGKMRDIYKDMHKPVTKTAPPKVAPKTWSSTKKVATQPTKPTNNYPTVTLPKSPTVNTPPPVVAKPTTPVPQQPTYTPTPYVPKVRDANGTVGPTDNGHHNWNSNQSIPDYGSMTPDMIQDMIENLTGGGKQYDPATDPAYQAVLQLAKKQADAQGLEAMEIMNERGILNSTVTSDRIGQIKQGASDAAIGTIPGLSANFINQQNNNQQNYQALLNSVMGGAQWQQDFAEGNRRFDKNYQLDEADVTGYYKPAEAVYGKGANSSQGVQTLKAQGQYADQALAKQKLQFEKDSFDRRQTFEEQDSYIQNDLKARGLDLEELKIGIDSFAAEKDADYKQRLLDLDVSVEEGKKATNRAIGQVLGSSSAAEGFAYIHSQTNAWYSSGVDMMEVINALESKFPGATEELMSDGGTAGFFDTP